ncbi:HAMP domain-containing methyl-accepting chemotaxis protein [Paenibacillus donghaensis]|uniref:HAMP domain-containing protein n=1 Tax=Paenibacillus donghaensis TaxID=414771 RepID=A0A2Z2KUY2_9BACL|nr:methyl-accepting chemotaxis protein [Paenibacillus donghaensis]ASA25972.1 hypothetical protein B9T62_37830 [Paenibacillus donghaensis]
MKNLKVRNKMTLLMVLIMIMMVGIGTHGILIADRTAKRATETYNENVLPISYLGQMRINNEEIESSILELLITHNSAMKLQLQGGIEQRIAGNDGLLNQLLDISFEDKPEIGGAINEYAALLPGYRAQRDTILRLCLSDHGQEAYDLYSGAFHTSRERMGALLHKLNDGLQQEAAAHLAAAHSESSYAKRANILLTLVIWMICAALCCIVARQIANPLKLLQARMKRAEEGDLKAADVYQANDEFGRINSSFNHMLGSLRSIMHRVAESVEMIAASSEEMSASARHSSLTADAMAEAASPAASSYKQQAFSVSQALEAVQRIAAEAAAIESSSLVFYKRADPAAADLGVDTVQHTREIIGAVAHIASESQAVAEALKQLQLFLDQGAEAVLGTGTKAREQMSAMLEISAQAQYLGLLSEDLQESVNRFGL